MIVLRSCGAAINTSTICRTARQIFSVKEKKVLHEKNAIDYPMRVDRLCMR